MRFVELLTSLLVVALAVQVANGEFIFRKGDCQQNTVSCRSGKCIKGGWFCDNDNDCGDGLDETYCGLGRFESCPIGWFKCSEHCIPSALRCDGIVDRPNQCDESHCTTTTSLPTTRRPVTSTSLVPLGGSAPGNNSAKGVLIVPGVNEAKRKLTTWFLKKRKVGTTTDRWSHQLPRIAVALYLTDERFFTPGNRTGEEIAYELTIQLLSKYSRNRQIRPQELSQYIQALLVACIDPRDFHGHNLVSDLREEVEASDYTSPFEILVLCNAGDTMMDNDVRRITMAFDSQHRPYWADTQAVAAMALECLVSRANLKVDERTIKDMQQDLKKRQFRNGTVDNLMTTALVVQALLTNETYKEYFDLKAAIEYLLKSQKYDGSYGSVQNSYYILPIFSNKNLLNISTSHCAKRPQTKEEALKKVQDSNAETFSIQYSVWIGQEVHLARTWKLKIKVNTTVYDVIEMMRNMDTKHNVEYHVIDDKPYVSTLYGMEDDPEIGTYWFMYVKSQETEDPKLVEASPVDIKTYPNQEIILWYKAGEWRNNSSADA